MEKFHIPRGNHSVLKSFFLILLPHVLLLSVTCFVVHYSFVKTKNALLQNEEAFFVQKNHKFIQNTFADIVADLKILANHNHVYSQAIGREAEKKELQNLFYSFAHYKRVYDQIRFLDATGMEIVRVNFSNGTAKIVPEDSLQFKGKRYYFNDTFQLDKNEIFIAKASSDGARNILPINLNIALNNVLSSTTLRTSSMSTMSFSKSIISFLKVESPLTLRTSKNSSSSFLTFSSP